MKYAIAILFLCACGSTAKRNGRSVENLCAEWERQPDGYCGWTVAPCDEIARPTGPNCVDVWKE